MTQSAPGWHPDPAGRFAQRYHDGSAWTEHVVDAQGGRSSDPVDAPGPPRTGYGSPPGASGPPTAVFTAPGRPYGAPPPGYGPPPGAGYGPSPGYGVAVPRGAYGAGPIGSLPPRRGPSTAGLIVAGIGAVLVLLGHLAALEWFSPAFGDEAGIDFGEVRDLAGDDGVSDFVPVLAAYGRFGWVLALLAAGLGVLGAAVRVPFRWVGMVAGIVMGLWCAGALGEFLGEDPFGTIEAGPGGGVAFIGLVMVAVGSALPSPRRA